MEAETELLHVGGELHLLIQQAHYCVPILLSGNTIGVINLYVKDGHSRVGREEEFLDSVANTLAGIIKRKRAEEELQRTLESLRKAFGATVQVMVSAIEAN
jgi:GAF domain-containing protein